MQQYPDSVITSMLLGYEHYQAKQWGNAIACFERVEDHDFSGLFFPYDIQFFQGWSYSRLREHENAIYHYEKALELEPTIPNALNNLGYEYYITKQYPKALETFEHCIQEKRDIRYAANNYVRTLLAMKRFRDAKEFVKHPPYKISSDLLRRVAKAEAINHEIPDDEEPDEATVNDVIAEKSAPAKDSGEQFSSEKVLEDELSMRIEAGVPVFGKHLKIYRRHGEYGRQYIIPIGRLDLLAEDDAGNLYIIELKKDSGYDDAYAQTAAYLDWFEKNRKVKGKIYGIICLNRPTEKVKAAVRKDSRIRLFNYSIAYEEVL
jgi:tetratricopeptide (TPR) repeat protein